ncbi:MAG: hypothetical protein IPH30_13235 [Betaproteobacteria bacterium]|nr:hypothetical protein [Betaproteobacteria bacterium]
MNISTLFNAGIGLAMRSESVTPASARSPERRLAASASVVKSIGALSQFSASGSKVTASPAFCAGIAMVSMLLKAGSPKSGFFGSISRPMCWTLSQLRLEPWCSRNRAARSANGPARRSRRKISKSASQGLSAAGCSSTAKCSSSIARAIAPSS